MGKLIITFFVKKTDRGKALKRVISNADKQGNGVIYDFEILTFFLATRYANNSMKINERNTGQVSNPLKYKTIAIKFINNCKVAYVNDTFR